MAKKRTQPKPKAKKSNTVGVNQTWGELAARNKAMGKYIKDQKARKYKPVSAGLKKSGNAKGLDMLNLKKKR